MAEQTFEDENGKNYYTLGVDVFNGVDELLQMINEKADDRSISFHKASLIFNKFETALSMVLSLTTLDIDLTENTRLVLRQLSQCLTELHTYWGTRTANIR